MTAIMNSFVFSFFLKTERQIGFHFKDSVVQHMPKFTWSVQLLHMCHPAHCYRLGPHRTQRTAAAYMESANRDT